MAVISHPFSQGQTRLLSEEAHFGDLYQTLSQQVISKIRGFCLEILDDPNAPPLPQEGTKLRLSFPKDKVQEIFQQAKADLLAQHQNPCLIERVCSVFNSYLSNKNGVSLSAKDLEGKGFLDTRMQTWAQQAQMRSLLYMEQIRGTKRREIPAELQQICCFRYALMEAGFALPFAVTKNNLRNLLEEECVRVQAPQEGDLVLFCKFNSPMHLGVICEGAVLSKEGNAMPVAYVRNLSDLTAQYGDQVIYFRRNEAMEVAQ